MTPTASSSSILLLNPTTPGGTAAMGGDAQAAPIAGLSGFELLLGAMQQLQQTLPVSTAPTDPTAEATENGGEQSGNALPLLGMLLPLSGATGDIESTGSKGDAEPVEKKEETADVDVDFLLFNSAQSTPLAVSNTSVSSDSSNVTATSLSVDSAQKPVSDITASTADEMLVQIVAPSVGASSKEASGGKTDRSAAASLKLGSSELGRASVDANAASSAGNVRALAQDLPDIALGNESDFDMLIKQFDGSSTQQSPVASAGIGDSSMVSQASRTYSNAMNSNASVPVPVGSNGWSDAIADKVMWFSASKISSAEIHLNPPDLGPLQVRVSTQNDQTSVIFTSQHAAVRDALDQALPRLRDMMGSQGMHQLDVSVGGQSAQQQQQQFTRNDSSQQGSQFAGFIGDDAADSKITNVTKIDTARLMRSGVDAYA